MTEQNPEIDPEQRYSVSEIARITGLHPNTIRNNIKVGNLKGKRGIFSNRWRVEGSDLIEYLEKR